MTDLARVALLVRQFKEAIKRDPLKFKRQHDEECKRLGIELPEHQNKPTQN